MVAVILRCTAENLTENQTGTKIYYVDTGQGTYLNSSMVKPVDSHSVAVNIQ